MRTILSILVPALVLAAACPARPAFALPEKEIPIIVEDEAAAPEAGKKAEIVAAPKAAAKAEAKREAKKAAPAAAAETAPAAEAKKLREGEPLGKLVNTFLKYRPDIALDPACFDEANAGFDAARAEALRADIAAWKKLRLEAKAAKGKDAAKFEKKYQEVRALEERILNEYGAAGKGAKEAAGKEAGAEAAAAAEGEGAAAKAAALADAAKTPEAKRILSRAAGKEGAREEKPAAKPDRSGDEEDRRAARADAEERIEKVRKEREGSRYLPAKIRWRPSRVLFNRLEPGGSDRSVFTIRNAGRSTFEGAIVAIEDWISVAPPTVIIEPNAEIEIDVQVKAPDKKNVRAEGSIEIRSVGESSRRVPVVLRTARK